MAMPTPPISAKKRQQVIDLHGKGLSRNEIARQVGIGPASVSRIAHEEGLGFDRAATVAATEARRADLAAKRAELEQDLLGDAQKLRVQLWQPHEYRQAVGGSDAQVFQWTLDQPTAMDKLKLMQAVGTAVDKSLKLRDANSDTGVEEARSMLGDLFESMTKAFRGDTG